MRNVSENFPIPSVSLGFPSAQRNPSEALYNSTTFGNNYNKNPSIYQGLKSIKEPENTEGFAELATDSGKEIFIEKENKKVKAIGIDEQNEIVKKVKEEELEIINEFKRELISINAGNDNTDTKITKIKNAIDNYTFEVALNRVSEGFVSNFIPLLKDIKTESFLTKIEEEIIIEDKEIRNILHERIKKETALTLIIELYKDIFEYLKTFVNVNHITNKEVRNGVRKIHPTRMRESELIKFVPVGRIIFSTKHPYGYFIKNRKRYFNVCKVPKIETKFKENGEKWTIEETLNILKNNYKRLFLVFKNLFRTDQNISYILNKYAYLLNTHKKYRTAEVIHGVQGAGKGVFANHFIKRIVGEDNYIEIGNEELQEKFNSFLEYKLFVVANEVAGDITKNNIVNNKIKRFTTDGSLLINTKSIKQYKGMNLFNMVIFSNSDEPIKVESSDRRFNVFKTRNYDLKVLVKEKFNEPMGEYINKLDKEVTEFLPILKGTEYDKELVNELINNNFRLKLKFETNNKIKLLKDLILKQEWKEVDKFLEHLKKENDLNKELILQYKDDVTYKFDVSTENLEKIKEQLKYGGFLTTEQVRLIVALMYYKDIQEKESAFKDKINKFNRAFSLVHKIKINNTKQSIRTCQDADYFEEERDVIVGDILYKVVCVDLEKEKLKFKKYKMLTKMEEASPEEI